MHVSRRILCGLSAVASLAALPSAAWADEGSYTTTTWDSPVLFAERNWTPGGIITPPAGVPPTATITSISGFGLWSQSPLFGSRYEHLLCDFADGEYNVSPVFFRAIGCTGFAQTTSQSWNVAGNTAFAGKPAATTRMYFTAQENDFSTSAIHDLLRPNRFLYSRSITVNYSF